MKNRFKTIELVGRVPVLIIGLWLACKFLFNGQYVDLLIMLIGAASWEFFMFFLFRFNIINMNEMWTYNENDDLIKEKDESTEN